MAQLDLGREFFAHLEQQDWQIAEQVAAEGCPVCGSPLHRANYDRKPRGALLAPEGEQTLVRFSLCCGREGCRKRTTPPSLRFLGRRVYLGAVVLVASLVLQSLAVLASARRATGVPGRTLRRWLDWWQGPFVTTEVFVAVRARLVGVEASELPASLVEKLAGPLKEQVETMLSLLSPLTTGSVQDGARFLRGVV